VFSYEKTEKKNRGGSNCNSVIIKVICAGQRYSRHHRSHADGNLLFRSSHTAHLCNRRRSGFNWRGQGVQQIQQRRSRYLKNRGKLVRCLYLSYCRGHHPALLLSLTPPYDYLQYQQRHRENRRVQGTQGAVPVHFRRRIAGNTYPGHDLIYGRDKFLHLPFSWRGRRLTDRVADLLTEQKVRRTRTYEDRRKEKASTIHHLPQACAPLLKIHY